MLRWLLTTLLIDLLNIENRSFYTVLNDDEAKEHD